MPILHQSDRLAIYRQLRSDLLRAARHHRRAVKVEGAIAAMHLSYLQTCLRQMVALRQAYWLAHHATDQHTIGVSFTVHEKWGDDASDTMWAAA